MVALRGTKRYYPIEPALYMNPEYWRAQVDPGTGKEMRQKAIIHARGNANSKEMERQIAAKEREMQDLIAAMLDKGETPDHAVLWRQWGKAGAATLTDCYNRYVEVRAGGWRGGLNGSSASAVGARFAYIVQFDKDAPLNALNIEWVRRLHNWLLKEVVRPRSKSGRRGLAHNTASSVLDVLGAILNLAVEEGHMKENPVTAYKKSKSSIQTRKQAGKANPLTEEEVERLQEVWESGDAAGGMRATLQQALVCIYTGLRVSDLAQLSDPSRFVLSGGHLMITTVKTRKTLKLLVTKRLAGVLAAQPDGSLLMKPVRHACHQSTRLRKLLKALGMERGAMVWHDLRKTFVNIMYARTGDLSAVSKAVGHASIAVTEGHYLNQSNDHIDRVMASLDSIGSKRVNVDGMEVLNEVAAMVAGNPAIRVTPRMAELLRVHCGMY
jgi:integrase